MITMLHRFHRWWIAHHLSERLRALAVFLPGVLLVVVIHVLFLQLDQGRDLVRLTLEDPLRRGIMGVAVILLAYISWYGARIISFLRWERTGVHPRIRSVLPRLIGFGTYMAAIVAIVRSGSDLRLWACECPVALAIVLELLVFVVLDRICDRLRAALPAAGAPVPPGLRSTLRTLRVLLFALLFTGPVVLLVSGCSPIGTLFNEPRLVPIVMLVVMQSVFLLLVNLRTRWLPMINPTVRLLGPFWRFLFPSDPGKHRPGDPSVLPYPHELWHFRAFNGVAGVLLLAMALLWAWPQAAPDVGGLAIAWASFALLTGAVNLLRVSARRTGLPIGLGLLGLVLVVGTVIDHHAVHTVTGAGVLQDRRPDIRAALAAWCDRQPPTAGDLPMVFVLADGGASRSAHWVLRVLHELQEREKSFPTRLFALSGTSGGAVGGAAYYLDLCHNDTLAANSIRTDLLSPALAHLLGPDLINLGTGLMPDRARALELGLERSHAAWRQPARELFSGSNTELPQLFLNTTRVHDGHPGVVSSMRFAGATDTVSRRTDLLAERLRDDVDLAFSSAAILSARFPYMSPAGGLQFGGRWNHYVDGGYFDNSGAGIVTEVLRFIAHAKKDSTRGLNWLDQVRPVVLHISNTRPDPAPRDQGRLHPLANDLAAPLLTVLGTYTTQTGINDQRLRDELRYSFDCDTCYVDINLYEEAAFLDLTMSWSMSRQMQDTVDALARRHPKLPTALRAMRPAE